MNRIFGREGFLLLIGLYLQLYTSVAAAFESKPYELEVISNNILSKELSQMSLFLEYADLSEVYSNYFYTMTLQEESKTPCIGLIKDTLSMSLKSVFVNSRQLKFVDFASQLSGNSSGFWNERVNSYAKNYMDQHNLLSMYSLVPTSTGCEEISVSDMNTELGIGFGSMKWFSVLSKDQSKQIKLKRICTAFNVNLMPRLVPLTRPKRHCVYFTKHSTRKNTNGSIAAFYAGKSSTVMEGVSDSLALEYLINVSVIATIADMLQVPKSIFLPYIDETILDYELDVMVLKFKRSNKQHKRVLLNIIAGNWGGVNLSSSQKIQRSPSRNAHKFLAKVANSAGVDIDDYDRIFEELIRKKDKYVRMHKKLDDRHVTTKPHKATKPQRPYSAVEERILVTPSHVASNWKLNLDSIRCSKKTCEIGLSRGRVDLYLLDGVEDAIEASLKDGHLVSAECNASKNRRTFSCLFNVTKGTRISKSHFKREMKKLSRT